MKVITSPRNGIKNEVIETSMIESHVTSLPTKVETSKNFPTTQAISEHDIDSIGSDIDTRVNSVTERIIKSRSLSRFNELGDIMARMQIQHKALDTNSISEDLSPKGIFKWFKKRVIDVRIELKKRLEDASVAFDSITEDIMNYISSQNIWIQDLEDLYKENMSNYEYVCGLIDKMKAMEEYQTQFIQNIPPIDPNDDHAMVKGQFLADAKNTLHLIQIRLDNFSRLKILIESNGPDIRSQQNTSRKTVQNLKEVARTIPLMKLEFAKFSHSLDTQDALKFAAGAKTLVNSTIISGSEQAKDAAIKSASQLNAPVIDTSTLDTLRNNMLERISVVSQIQQSAIQQREADKIYLQNSQSEYLKTLTSKGAV